MSKRRSAAPRPAPRKRDRRQLYIALLAIFLVLTMLFSGFIALFYGST